ncbi:RAB6A-GEF complex partner protein 2-like isoform X2 [Lepeophtheirus salmonis]|uniref:RAB6A-GEF complex partner protein 2-like isoform X2 n=1 Tax=Lepeophtheirus salmonis TaxID=72036 RepID=UPI003AF39347
MLREIFLEKCCGRLEAVTRIRKSSQNQYRTHSEESTIERDLLGKDIVIQPNVQKKFKFQEIIPSHWPPSFGGKWIQYHTKLKICFKYKDKSEVSLEFLIKSRSTRSFLASPTKSIGMITPVSACTMRRINPFLEETPCKIEKINIFQSPRQIPHFKNVFKIQENCKEIVRIHNIGSEYSASQKIFGILNFGNAELHCMKFTASLVSIEAVPMRDSLIQFKDEKKRWVHLSEITFGIESMGFELVIPDFVTPTFITDLVMLKWCVQFTFYLSENNLKLQSKDPEWEAPHKIPVITKTWTHPIKMYSPQSINDVE